MCIAAKNGYYGDLVQNIREAFQEDDLVRIDCTPVERPDYKKIGAKLRVMSKQEWNNSEFAILLRD